MVAIGTCGEHQCAAWDGHFVMRQADGRPATGKRPVLRRDLSQWRWCGHKQRERSLRSHRGRTRRCPPSLSATVTGLPIAQAVPKLPGPKPDTSPAVAVLVLPIAMAPSKRPWADVDELLSSPTAKLVGVLVQSAPAPLMYAQFAPATPAELSAAMAIAAEASTPCSNLRAAPDVDLGVPSATASNCPTTSAFHDSPAAPGNRFRHNSYLSLSHI